MRKEKKFPWWLVFFVVAADQLSKYLIVQGLPLGSVAPVLPGFFDVVHYRNPGAAFGILAGLSEGVRCWIFYVLAAVAAVFLRFYWKSLKPREKLSQIAIPLVYGGILGNIIDRIRFGEVIDFLSFHWHDTVLYGVPLSWPAFNVADSAISIAVVLLLVEGLRGSSRR